MIAMGTHLEAPVATTPTVPAPQRHHDGRSWTSYWRDDRGKLRTKRLGREDEMSKREAMAIWHTWKQDEWAKPHIRNPDSDAAKFSAAMLASAYREYAKATFIKNGVPTSQLGNINLAMDDLEAAWSEKPIVQIPSCKLAELRDAMIFDKDGQARSVSTVNDRFSIIKAALIWGASEKGFYPDEKATAFKLVKPLRAGRCEARMPRTIRPVADVDRLAAQAKMPQVVADMVEVQMLTGMRSGELVIMRDTDIDTSQNIWLYTPQFHKTEHLGKTRVIAIGPKAKRIIKKYLKKKLGIYLFSPREAQAERLKAIRATRTTKLWPSHKKHRTYKPSPLVGTRYTPKSYRRSIYYACIKANIAPWHPHQLRHGFGTVVRELFDLEHAASGMGNSIQVAEIYAARSLKRAKEVARKVG